MFSALRSGIRIISDFCHSYSFSNNVKALQQQCFEPCYGTCSAYFSQRAYSLWFLFIPRGYPYITSANIWTLDVGIMSHFMNQLTQFFCWGNSQSWLMAYKPGQNYSLNFWRKFIAFKNLSMGVMPFQA